MSGKLVWDDARVFLAVARTGTLSGASVQVGGGIATISRRIERLESALGVPLFARHQSGYRLTDDGAALVEKAESLEAAAMRFGAQIETLAEVSGRVRLATAENLANPIIIPELASLLRKHPRLELEIVTDVSSVNLHRRDADLAIRMIKPKHGNVTVRRLGVLGFGLYGSKEYFAARDRVGNDVAGLDSQVFLGWTEAYQALPAARWIERVARGKPPSLVTSTLSAQLSAARSGMGLAILPHFLALEAGLEALPVELGIDQSIWIVIHSDLTTSRRVRTVADHVIEIIQKNRERLEFGKIRGETS